MRDYALNYAARGWPVFPLGPRSKKPLKGSRGFLDATTDKETIRRWWDEVPDANIGLATGEAMGVWVLDVDGPEGSASLTQLEVELGALPDTLDQRTGGGGRHLFFEWPGDVEVRCKQSVRPGIDVRGNGGYVVAPPSVHPNGNTYDWPCGDGCRTYTAPAGWINFLAPPEKTTPPWEKVDPLPNVPRSIPMTPVSERASLYLAECDPAILGSGGHSALLWAARALVVGFELDDATALGLLWGEFNPRCIPPWDESDESSRRDFERKVGQARKGPCKKPSGWLIEEFGLRDAVADDALLAAGRKSAALLLARSCVGDAVDEFPADEVVPGLYGDSGVTSRIPGFISEVMDVCLETAPYPNEKLAFAGALAAQAFLASRKIRDCSDVRPNLYLLALAASGSGKEHPRKLNKLIARHAGISVGVVDSVASGQGVEDALLGSPAMLLQLDEADSLLRAMSDTRDQRAIELQRVLLTLYSASSSDHRVRVRAGDDMVAVIDQPHLTLLGSAIPKHFFGALSENMLTNGLAARLLVIDATGPRVGQQACAIELPERVVETALWWQKFTPSGNDLNVSVPRPVVIPPSDGAERLLIDFRVECEERWRSADADAESERTIHARTCEMARKLALIYSVSAAPDPSVAKVTADAAAWSTGYARQQADQVLHLIDRHGATSPFDKGCRLVLGLVRGAPKRKIPRSSLLRKLRVSSRQMDEWLRALLERDEIKVVRSATSGRTATAYTLSRSRS